MSQWTTDKPKVPGWYWWRTSIEDTNPEMCLMYTSLATVSFMDEEGYQEWDIKKVGGEWQGPIVPKEEE